ncbi:unnamed protein product [Acanthoscelides obtectus]|uniref:Uncharacterized protein n=1 Tax=Acanthoscelides obtectus TaxID=200917 RepID=A0A9P0JXX6_ACAOB|nr:unnamed protein product [Acanthoscelides obtectus]CAK1663994.1 hypothetical protein AOBTE_LOCUS23993 [Acanthoscelides obtectus]
MYTMLLVIFTIFATLLQLIPVAPAIRTEENGKYLDPTNSAQTARRRRPFGGGGSSLPAGCQFRRQPQRKQEGMGRFLLDLAYVNVANNYQTNILCVPGGGVPPHEGGGNAPVVGGSGPTLGGGGHKPILHKPILGGNGGNRPLLSMIIANRPLETLVGAFSQSQSQSQGQSGILGDFLSGFTSVLPSAQQVGQGFGEGLSSFVQTIPQIGQSFASLLPNFDNFQLPFLPSVPQGRPFSKIPPGQYLVASHPWFGTHTHDVTGLADVFNPFKLVEEAAEALVGLFG